jgi:hypothetical protein
MNKKNLELWVQALESGQYQQGKRALAQVEVDTSKAWYKPWTWRRTPIVKYCCLGVACEVARQQGVNLRRRTYGRYASNRFCGVSYGVGESTMLLPHEVVDWLDCTTPDPYVAPHTLATEANDQLYWTFPRIAQELRNLYLTENTETEEVTDTHGE